MQVTAFLSDLRSLSVCSHEAAIGLVQTYRTRRNDAGVEAGQPNQTKDGDLNGTSKSTDKDLQRAEELVSLHQNVKLKHIQNGQDRELLQSRQAVQAVLASLNKHQDG